MSEAADLVQPMGRNEQLVRGFLAVTGLSLSAEEVAEFARALPVHRRAVDALYFVPMDKEEEPQMIFSPVHELSHPTNGSDRGDA